MKRRKFTQQIAGFGIISLATPNVSLPSTPQKTKYDLIIVGAGTAGIPCAIAAAENGAKVLVIEKDSKIGGTLHSTGGHLSAGGTNQQRKKGIEDSTEKHFEDVIRICKDTADRALVRLACEEAPKTIDWLDDLGFEFADESPRIVYGHVPYAVARTHYGKDAGKSILKVLQPLWDKWVAKGNISILLNHQLTNLIQKEGIFVGVKSQNQNKIHTFWGNSIVLTTGGYAANPTFFKKAHPDFDRLISTASHNSQGEGIQIATQYGANFRWAEKHISSLGGVELEPNSNRADFWKAWAMVFTTTYRKTRELYINQDGKRFMNESNEDPDYRERIVAQQKGKRFWAIFDEKSLSATDKDGNPLMQILPKWTAEQIREEALKEKCIWKADSIQALAQKIGVNSQNLEDEIKYHNQVVAGNYDDKFGNYDTNYLQNPPYYALLVYATSLISFGGLEVDTALQVLDSNGKAMPNLYAAGEIIGAAATTGNAFCGGMLLTPAISFGRILGKRLATISK